MGNWWGGRLRLIRYSCFERLAPQSKKDLITLRQTDGGTAERRGYRFFFCCPAGIRGKKFKNFGSNPPPSIFLRFGLRVSVRQWSIIVNTSPVGCGYSGIDRPARQNSKASRGIPIRELFQRSCPKKCVTEMRTPASLLFK